MKRLLAPLVVLFASVPLLASDGPVRTAYAVRYADAKSVADALAKHYAGDDGKPGAVRVVAEPTSRLLLVTAPNEKAAAEVMRIVEMMDREPKALVVEIVIADLAKRTEGDKPGEDFSAGDAAKKLEALRKAGGVTAVRRYRLSALEGRPVNVSAGESKAMVVGLSDGRGLKGGFGGSSRSVSYRDVGVVVEATAHLVGDKAQVALRVQDSGFAKGDAGPVLGKDDAGTAVTAPEMYQLSAKGTVAVPLGRATLFKDGGADAGAGRKVILVTVTAADAAPGAK